MAAILFWPGAVSFSQLPVSALPQVDYPTIQVAYVSIRAPARLAVMSTTVAMPLERQFGELQGLSQMTSTSSGGTSVVVLQFNLSMSIDVAEEEVQSAISAAQSLFAVHPCPRRLFTARPTPPTPPCSHWRSLQTPSRCRRWKTLSIRAWPQRFRSSTGSAWSASAEDKSPPCVFRPIRRRFRLTASTWRTCEPL